MNEIAARPDLTEHKVSKHLKGLREAGPLKTVPQCQERRYAIPAKLHGQLQAGVGVLNLCCRTFRPDRLPK